MSEKNEALRAEAEAASAPESEEASAGIVAAGADEDTPAFEGMSAGDVGGAVVPGGVLDLRRASEIEDTDDGEASTDCVEDAASTVFVLTSPTYGNAGQGTHVVGIFESEEAATAYRDGAEPRVNDGVITEFVVE